MKESKKHINEFFSFSKEDCRVPKFCSGKRLVLSISFIIFQISLYGQLPSYFNKRVVASDKYADIKELTYLKELLKDKRIVFLGEANHYDQKELNLKTKVINYLHQELGFDILVTESNFFETDFAYRQILNKEDSPVGAIATLMENIPSRITRRDLTTASLINEIRENRQPLKLMGLDILHGNGYGEAFHEDAENFFKENYDEFEKTEGYTFFKNFYLKGQIPRDRSRLADLIKSKGENYFITNANGLTDWIDSALINGKSSDTKKASFYRQAVKSDLLLYLHSFRETRFGNEAGNKTADFHAIRDSGMALNLEWILNTYSKSTKIIVSTSSYHLLRDVKSLYLPLPDMPVNVKPMLSYLWNKYNDQAYSIAFFSGAGSVGREDFYGALPKLKPVKKSLEYSLVKGDDNYLFFNYSENSEIGYPPLLMMPTFHNYRKLDWSKQYDAFFFSKIAQPLEVIYLPIFLEKKKWYLSPDSWLQKVN